jgi:hypothetical protein
MIEINYRVYNKLARALQRHRANEKKVGFNRGRFPWLFLVANKEGEHVITKTHQLKENTDRLKPNEQYRKIEYCYRMSNLSAKRFIQPSLPLMKKGYVVRGLARVGNFTRPDMTHHNDGSVEGELANMNKDMLFITVEPTNFYMHCNSIMVPYRIIIKE